MEKARLELATSALQRRRSPSVSYIPKTLLPNVWEARTRNILCLLVLESRVRIELTSNGGKNPAPYQSRHRPEKSRRRDSNPQPSACEADELPIAPLCSSGGRTRTCDLRVNSVLFCLLNYTGMIPGQDGPDRGLLLNIVGYPILNGPGNHAP